MIMMKTICLTSRSEMKHIVLLLQSLLLSALIVVMGSGVAFEDCCMKQSAEAGMENAANSAETENAEEDGGCCSCGCEKSQSSNCTMVRIVKLSPSNVAQSFSFKFRTAPVAAAAVEVPVFTIPVPLATDWRMELPRNRHFTPPRVYLRRLRVLQI